MRRRMRRRMRRTSRRTSRKTGGDEMEERLRGNNKEPGIGESELSGYAPSYM